MTPAPLTIKQTAEALAISPDLVRSLIKSGDLEAFDFSARPGSGNASWRISLESIESFKRSRRVTPQAAKTTIRRRRKIEKPSRTYV